MAPKRENTRDHVRYFTGGRCHICKKVTEREMVRIPMTTDKGYLRYFGVHSFCAFRMASQLRTRDVHEALSRQAQVVANQQAIINHQSALIRRTEVQLSRLVDTSRYQAATALMNMSVK